MARRAVYGDGPDVVRGQTISGRIVMPLDPVVPIDAPAPYASPQMALPVDGHGLHDRCAVRRRQRMRRPALAVEHADPLAGAAPYPSLIIDRHHRHPGVGEPVGLAICGPRRAIEAAKAIPRSRPDDALRADGYSIHAIIRQTIIGGPALPTGPIPAAHTTAPGPSPEVPIGIRGESANVIGQEPVSAGVFGQELALSTPAHNAPSRARPQVPILHGQRPDVIALRVGGPGTTDPRGDGGT